MIRVTDEGIELDMLPGQTEILGPIECPGCISYVRVRFVADSRTAARFYVDHLGPGCDWIVATRAKGGEAPIMKALGLEFPPDVTIRPGQPLS